MSDSNEPLDPATQSADPSPVEEAAPEPEAPTEATADEAGGGDRPESTKHEAPRKWRREPGLALSFRKALPVEGIVEQVIRGGYEVRVGKARGFCPHSQMDVQHVDRPEDHIGKTYPFKVLQLRRGGEEVVLSRRALLEESRTEEAKAVRATLIEGHVTQGHVVRLTDFGAFVDVGAGVTGLVHVSEIAHARVVRPHDVLKPGDTVQVKVLSLAPTGRISLSIRQAQGDPWTRIAERLRPGAITSGILRRLADFGVFVEIEPGIEGLASSDSFPPGPSGWREGLEPGSTRPWKIVSVDPERRRIALQPADGEVEAAPLESGAKTRGRVQKVEKFGVFVWLRPGVVGLLPNVLTGTKRGTDLTTVFPAGKEIEVEVLEADPDGRRVRLSIPGAQAPAPPTRSRPQGQPRERDRDRDRERPSRSAEVAAPAGSGASFGTSLGDKLRAAFEKKNPESS